MVKGQILPPRGTGLLILNSMEKGKAYKASHIRAKFPHLSNINVYSYMNRLRERGFLTCWQAKPGKQGSDKLYYKL